MGTTEERHTIRITGIECIPVTTVIICIKPRWAQSARFGKIIFWLAFAGASPLGDGSAAFASMHVYEVRPRKDNRGVDLISDALPFGRLWYDGAERCQQRNRLRQPLQPIT